MKIWDYWFASSHDGGETWQLTDGPFTASEADRVKASVDKPWVLVVVASVEGTIAAMLEAAK